MQVGLGILMAGVAKVEFVIVTGEKWEGDSIQAESASTKLGGWRGRGQGGSSMWHGAGSVCGHTV